MKKIILSLLFVLVLLPTVCNAETIYYTNEKGVQLTKEEYETLLNFFNENQIKSMSSSKIDKYKNMKNVGVETIYEKTMTYYNANGQAEETVSAEVSRQEYENPISTYGACDTTVTTVACWETNYKQLTMSLWGPEINPEGHHLIVVINRWKTIPKILSFDVIGVRYTNFSVATAWGDQDSVDKNYNSLFMEYGCGGTNMRIQSNGIGITQNLFNASYNHLTNRIVLEGTPTANHMEVWGAYQHATRDVNLIVSQQYDIGNGMGGVFDFYQGVIQYYDNMNGVYSSWYPFG